MESLYTMSIEKTCIIWVRPLKAGCINNFQVISPAAAETVLRGIDGYFLVLVKPYNDNIFIYFRRDGPNKRLHFRCLLMENAFTPAAAETVGWIRRTSWTTSTMPSETKQWRCRTLKKMFHIEKNVITCNILTVKLMECWGAGCASYIHFPILAWQKLWDNLYG